MTPTNLRWRRLARLATALLALAAGGCAHAGQVQINVHAAAGANRGLPLYLVVRSVEQSKFLSEPYSAIANEVISPDESVLQTTEIYPGRDSTLTVQAADKKPVAVYFLFTYPGIRWRQLLETPVPQKCNVTIDANEIQDVKSQ